MAEIIVETPRPGILRLIMSEPVKKNAMSRAMREQLLRALESAVHDPAVHAVVLTGANGTYSAGGDLDGIAQLAPETFRSYLADGHKLVRAAYHFPKPLVAAIEGVGVGGGVALALCGDLILMSRSARLGLPFLKIGFVPDWGTLHTLPRRVGWQNAYRLFAMAGLIGAEEAARIGLCDEVADEGAVQARAVETAAALAQQPPNAFAQLKRIMGDLSGSLDAALEAELDAQDACFRGAEFAEGLKAFREKRAPDFRRG